MIDEPLLLNFRFAVSFLAWGGQSAVIDTRFQRVSGLGASVTTSTIAEGGQNLFTQSLPDKVGYTNLVLERGRILKSTVNSRFDDALARFEFKPTDVLVTLLGELRTPLAAWMFYRAYPVKWSTSDLSAAAPAILIDTMELAYTRMQPLQV
jgi:phage tail-like protein